MEGTEKGQDPGRIGALLKNAVSTGCPNQDPNFGKVYSSRKRETLFAGASWGLAAGFAVLIAAGLAFSPQISSFRNYASEVANLGREVLPLSSGWIIEESVYLVEEGGSDFLSGVWNGIAVLYEPEER